LWNYSDKHAFGEHREIQIVLKFEATPFSSGAINQKKYLIDSHHCNITKIQNNPSLQLLGSNILKGKKIIKEQLSLENGGVIYIELEAIPCSFKRLFNEWR